MYPLLNLSASYFWTDGLEQFNTFKLNVCKSFRTERECVVGDGECVCVFVCERPLMHERVCTSNYSYLPQWTPPHCQKSAMMQEEQQERDKPSEWNANGLLDITALFLYQNKTLCVLCFGDFLFAPIDSMLWQC